MLRKNQFRASGSPKVEHFEHRSILHTPRVWVPDTPLARRSGMTAVGGCGTEAKVAPAHANSTQPAMARARTFSRASACFMMLATMSLQVGMSWIRPWA